MLRYLAGRLAIAAAVSLFVLIGLSAVVRFLPGDAATAILRERATPQLIERVRDEMGLNDPVPVQVGKFVGNAVTGDLGEDFFTRRPVLDIVTDALPHTIVLAVSSMLVATLLGDSAGRAGCHPTRARSSTGSSP